MGGLQEIAALLLRCRPKEQAALDPLGASPAPLSKVARSGAPCYPSREQVCGDFVPVRLPLVGGAEHPEVGRAPRTRGTPTSTLSRRPAARRAGAGAARSCRPSRRRRSAASKPSSRRADRALTSSTIRPSYSAAAGSKPYGPSASWAWPWSRSRSARRACPTPAAARAIAAPARDVLLATGGRAPGSRPRPAPGGPSGRP